MSSQKFTVKHERHTRTGVQRLTDPRDIYELTANQAGRRLRARILAVIPPDLVDAAVEQCRRTIAGDTSEPLQDKVRKMLQAFAPFGITKEHIEAKLGKKLDMILADEVVEFQAIYRSIKDGIYKPSDYFNVSTSEGAEPSEKVEKLNEKLSNPKPKPATKSAKPVSPEPQPVSVESEPQPQEADDEELL